MERNREDFDSPLRKQLCSLVCNNHPDNSYDAKSDMFVIYTSDIGKSEIHIKPNRCCEDFETLLKSNFEALKDTL